MKWSQDYKRKRSLFWNIFYPFKNASGSCLKASSIDYRSREGEKGT